MDNEIKMIIDEYIANVNDVCHKLIEGINAQENLNLRTKWDFFEYRSKNRKIEFSINGIDYKLHGRGCFAFSRELFLNWDFGYRSRWCGVDPWMIGMTLKENKSKHVKYYDGELIQEACKQALLDGEMFEKHDLYYFTIPISETFEPCFPKEFDTLLVEQFDFRWKIPRNKLVDRFIRKSKRVYKEIQKSHNLHMLRFIFDGKEVYSIPYDDIGYPENAVKIMNEMLKEYQKEPINDPV